MNAGSVVGGLIGATYLIPISIAFALAASHGKYLPLWLPYTGLLGAYGTYVLGVVVGAPKFLSLLIGIFLAAALSLAIHFALFREHVDRREPYPALLRGIAITILAEAALGWATHGYSLEYSRLRFGGAVYVPSLGETITAPDLAAAFFALTLAPLMGLVLQRTWPGVAFRSVSSNRNLARAYGLPVRYIDIGVAVVCGGLSALGAIMSAMKFDLSPQMLSEPTMKVAAVVVAFGAESPGRVTAGIFLIGIVEAATQASSVYAPFASAVGYLLLIGALVVRHMVPLLTRRYFAE